MNVEIKTDGIFKKFKKDFEIPENNRILFSGKFGTGKSTFLTKFFDENTQQKYNVIKLYPISYSIAQNEDIFELIKYDLLFQLFERSDNNEIELNNEDYSQVLSFQMKFLKTMDWQPVMFRILELLDKTGNASIVEKIANSFKNQYQQFKDNIIDEEQALFDFFYSQYSKLGSTKERDLTSKLTEDLLVRLNQANGRENILIIEDLDRLDPEHIFRIFNIFSVNFGEDEINNKFGFDKIIFVCDLDNIRRIFSHFYGNDVDFEGYIDKFYSVSPFKFNTNDILIAYISELVKNFNLPESFLYTGDLNYMKQNRVYLVLHSILKILIYEKKLNLRTLLNSKNLLIEEDSLLFLPNGKKEMKSSYPILSILEIINIMLDSPEETQKVFNSIDQYTQYQFSSDADFVTKDYVPQEFVELMTMCLPFLVDLKDIESHTRDIRPFDKKQMEQNIEGIGYIIFTVERSSSGNLEYNFSDISKNAAGKPYLINPFKVLNLVNQRRLFSRKINR